MERFMPVHTEDYFHCILGVKNGYGYDVDPIITIETFQITLSISSN